MTHDSTKPHERCMIRLGLDAGHQYEVFFNGKPVQYRSGHAGMLETTLPATNKTGELGEFELLIRLFSARGIFSFRFDISK